MGKYEVTEACPHCEREITLCWDVEADGYQIFCPECGKAVMLCSMCDRSPCDWTEKGCKHSNEKYWNVNNEGWISVEDRLPEFFEPVIVCRDDGRVEQGYKIGGDWWKVYGTRTKDVTHWMPFPAPYHPYRPEQAAPQRPEWKDRMLHTFLGGHT